MYTKMIRRIMDNVMIRILLKPFVVALRKVEHVKYVNSIDSKYIGGLRNIYEGKRCFVIGNGPSLTTEDLESLKGEVTFACNRIYDIFAYTGWRPTYYMCIDSAIISEMRLNQSEILTLSQSEIFCINRSFVQNFEDKLNIHEIFLEGAFLTNINKLVMDGVSENVSDHFTKTLSVVCTMIEFAFYMGFKEIYLLGIDHYFGIEINMNGDKVINRDVQAHFKEQKDKSVFPARKEALTRCYEVLRDYADLHGVIIKNLTRGGKLEVFERDSLENILSQ